MISLRPATPEVARAVVHGDCPLPQRRASDWPTADTADALRPLADHPESSGEGAFLVLEDDLVVGECGWSGTAEHGEVRIGYGLAPSARGRGTGTEAVRLLLARATEQGATRARAEVLPGNEPSLRLLTGLGFRAEERLGGHEQLLRDLDQMTGRRMLSP